MTLESRNTARAETSTGERGIPLHRRMVVLTEGCSTPEFAKTAISLLRYRADDVEAVLDSQSANKTCQAVFGAGGTTPIVSSLDEIAEADALVLGIALAGGRIPTPWRPTIIDAIQRGLDVVSGLHEFLSADDQFHQLAQRHSVRLIDVRKNNEKCTATGAKFRGGCLRVHTVGQDCSVGKMVAALEVQRELVNRGFDAGFAATGQTGIMISGSGTPIDCVVADFVNGAAERLVLDRQHHDFLLIEGQGSITHPAFSGVTLGLLHGCAPDGLILCYEAGRKGVKSLEHISLYPLGQLRDIYESLAALRHPCRVIAVAVNSRRLDVHAANQEVQRVEDELGLPACDVYRDGPDKLVQAVLTLDRQLRQSNTAPASATIQARNASE